jgi:hypothetical protein
LEIDKNINKPKGLTEKREKRWRRVTKRKPEFLRF